MNSNKTTHECSHCSVKFSTKFARQRHEQLMHGPPNTVLFECRFCSKITGRKDNFRRHFINKHLKTFKNPRGGSVDREYKPKNHRVRGLSFSPNRNVQLEPKYFKQKPNQQKKRKNKNQKAFTPTKIRRFPKNLLPIPLDSKLPPQDPQNFADSDIASSPDSIPSDLFPLFEKDWHYIRTQYRRNKILETFNFRLNNNFNAASIREKVREVSKFQVNAHYLNFEFGYMLERPETDETPKELKYHYRSWNGRFFDKSVLIKNEQDLEDALDELNRQDILEWAKIQRPSSAWIVRAIPNMTVKITKVQNHPIGSGFRLPHHIRSNRAIISLDSKPKDGSQYLDEKCLLRCLALHLGYKLKQIEGPANDLLKRWCAHSNQAVEKFIGVFMSEIPEFEKCFNVKVAVWQLIPKMFNHNSNEQSTGDLTEQIIDEKESENDCNEFAASLIRRADTTDPTKVLNVNLYGHHMSYIKDVKMFANSYHCTHCNKFIANGFRFNAHTKSCKGGLVKHRFIGGAYKAPKTVFELLDSLGVSIPEELRYYKKYIVYDWEAYFAQENTIKSNTDATTYISTLEPASVSVCSNQSGFDQPKFFLSNGQPKQLVSEMVSYMQEIQKSIHMELKELYNPYLKELHRQKDIHQERGSWIITAKTLKRRKRKFSEVASDEQWAALCNRKVGGRRLNRKRYYQSSDKFLRAIMSLELWMKEIPVFGFNSGKFDMNLIRRYFIPLILETIGEQPKNTIKRCSNYMSMCVGDLRFLDISNYLAAGTSYDAWLKAYKIDQEKIPFCYEWFTSLEKLKQTCLPPKSDFYSTLKGQNISDEEYAKAQKIWNDYDMKTMKDYLTLYNNRDTIGFVQAVSKMRNWWESQGICMLKEGISLPGLALKHLFLHARSGACFVLPNNEHQDMYWLMKDNIVGGPSIIFHRYHERDKTRLRDPKRGKLCKKIFGFDANALYLHSTMQQQATGIPIRWLPTDDSKTTFQRAPMYKHSVKEVQWLEWMAHSLDIKVQHQMNGGQINVGSGIDGVQYLPVDGFCEELGVCFEFDGCLFHGHRCNLTKWFEEKSVDNTKLLKERKLRTEQKRLYIESLGYRLESIRECEFDREVRTNSELRYFLKDRFELRFEKRRAITVTELLKAIEDESFFGLVECDISTPNHLKEHFAELCPIFKNVDIDISDIGSFMRKYAKKHGLMKKPRRGLICSYFGSKILLATPLLRWYLRHGLEVTNVHQAFQFKPMACFKEVGELIAENRRKADIDPDMSIIAELFKTTGNSYYGKTITNVLRHKKVTYCTQDTVNAYINDPQFCDLNEISEDCYEVLNNKQRIDFKLPTIVGIFVYQYSKLRLLEFYYDFLDIYWDRSDFCLLECDTDSLYFAASSDDFESLVKPELKKQFSDVRNTFLPRTEPPTAAKFDKRTPGLFKLEFVGDGFVGLCSKTYYCWNNSDRSKDKIACKGISKRSSAIRRATFKKVLKKRKNSGGDNFGFMMKNGVLTFYKQHRNSLSYFYPKRKVLKDGVSTKPLSI